MTLVKNTVQPIADAVHICVDMQNIFAKGGVWETPWMDRVLPAIVALTAAKAERTVFTRFITPETADKRPGRWQQYFRRWAQATRAHLAPGQLELVPELERFVPPALVVDKPGYSAFSSPRLYPLLVQRNVGTVVLSGTETDVCVLATALGAVDFGFRVVIVEDALCSSLDAGHDALMTLYRNRFSEQIDVVTLDELKVLWPDEDARRMAASR
ncbi:cysteine hydrolase [Bradyrhizobium sp.]|uniref:cysteine hydrolase family protein n=1 Tax=Bradyrhizobium sp. TaxID=376 RepID=UPI0025C0175E|nr:cysteine hydrolase [Bradyrhizobium sp.]